MSRFIEHNKLAGVWLCSATVVVVARLLHASDPNYDLGIQLQAAHNLLAGHGLSTYQHVAPNLTEPRKPHHPDVLPGRLLARCSGAHEIGLQRGSRDQGVGGARDHPGLVGVGEALAFLLQRGLAAGTGLEIGRRGDRDNRPLLFTPPWGGTDIFLWAIVPWMVECTVRASDENAAGSWRFDVLAGGLCGLAMLMRYASLFLVVYAAGIMIWQSQARIPTLTRRWSAFGAGALPALALQGYVNYVLSNAPVVPGGLFVAPGEGPLRRLWVGAQLLRHADYLWAFWVPGKVASRLFAGGISAPPWRLGLTACAVPLAADVDWHIRT